MKHNLDSTHLCVIIKQAAKEGEAKSTECDFHVAFFCHILLKRSTVWMVICSKGVKRVFFHFIWTVRVVM